MQRAKTSIFLPSALLRRPGRAKTRALIATTAGPQACSGSLRERRVPAREGCAQPPARLLVAIRRTGAAVAPSVAVGVCVLSVHGAIRQSLSGAGCGGRACCPAVPADHGCRSVEARRAHGVAARCRGSQTLAAAPDGLAAVARRSRGRMARDGRVRRGEFPLFDRTLGVPRPAAPWTRRRPDFGAL